MAMYLNKLTRGGLWKDRIRSGDCGAPLGSDHAIT